MKAYLLIIMTIVMITSACQINREMLTLDNPSIKIKDINVITSPKGKVICYTINLYSPSRLSEFVAIPDVAGENRDSVTKFIFGNHARRATVTYYYAVPENSGSEHVNIKFCLNDNLLESSVATLLHAF